MVRRERKDHAGPLPKLLAQDQSRDRAGGNARQARARRARRSGMGRSAGWRDGGGFVALAASRGLTNNFWRRRASSSTTTIFIRVPRAIISSSATIVKSFLRVWTKFFRIAMVFWRGGADYTVVVRRCQVLFTGKVQIFQKRSLAVAPFYAQVLKLSRTFCGIFANNFA